MIAPLRRLALLAWACYFAADHARAHSEGQYPINYLTLVDDPHIHTPSRRVHAHSNFDLTFWLHAKRQRVKLRLEPNHDIIGEGARVEYLDAEGRVARTEPIDRAAHKVYKGLSWLEDSAGSWKNVGWARIVVRRDGVHPLFEGGFTVDDDHHHIKLRSHYQSTRHERDPHAEEADDEYMVVFRDSDVERDPDRPSELRRRTLGTACPADQLRFNADHPHIFKREVGIWSMMPTGSLLAKRQLDTVRGGNGAGVNLRSTIGQTAGCPNTRRVALIGVATDCTFTAAYNSSESARQDVITQMNTASTLYESTFNITLGLSNLTVSDSNCPGTPPPLAPWNIPCSSATNIQDRLNIFSRWRGERGDPNVSHWTLLSTCNSGSAVGLAWLGQACVSRAQTTAAGRDGNETVSGANVVIRTRGSQLWQVLAHETGHTFGAVHDCTADSCRDGNTVSAQRCCPLNADTCDAREQYIMSPSTGQSITRFSPCSIGNICSAMGRNSVKTDCFSANRGVITVTGNQCGNGIVEAGEECDCGGEANCAGNRCCDPNTCRFRNNAVCDDSNEDCCRDCQFAPATQVCRASTGQCDPEERCSGNNSTCPSDNTSPDGTSCGNGTQSLSCASGQCTSRDLQCRTLMGSFTPNNDTYACDANNCQLSCASPAFGSGVCYSMQQNFLDGTSCGGGGRCQNGQCQGSDPVREIGSWISRNRGVVIGVASALGALLLFSFICCVWGCVRRRKSRNRYRKRKVPSPPGWPAGQPPNRAGPPQMMGTAPAGGAPSLPPRRSRGPSNPSTPQWDGPLPPQPTFPRAAAAARYA